MACRRELVRLTDEHADITAQVGFLLCCWYRANATSYSPIMRILAQNGNYWRILLDACNINRAAPVCVLSPRGAVTVALSIAMLVA